MSIRSSNFSHDEDILLCRAYMEISQDPCVGVHQTLDRFWLRVEECYNNEKGEEWNIRTKRSLHARMQTIEKATRKLHACVRKINDRHPSGASNEDIMRQAKVLFKEDVQYKSGWKYDHLWDLIKDFEKFQDCGKKTRRSSLGVPSSDSENPTSEDIYSFALNLEDNDNVLGGSPSERPFGIKKAKLKRKKEVEVSTLINVMHEENKQLVEEFKKSNTHMEHHLEIQKKSQALKDKNFALKEMMAENQILLQDMSGITDPQIRAHVEAQQRHILQKRALQQQDPEDPFTIGSMNQYFDNIGGSGSGFPNY